MPKYKVELTFEAEARMSPTEVRRFLMAAICTERNRADKEDAMRSIDRDSIAVGRVTIQEVPRAQES